MNNTTIINLLKNRIREVTVTDSATNESKTVVKGVNLKAKDFASRDEWKAYSRRLLDLIPAMHAAAAALDNKDADFTAARKNAMEHLQGIANLLCNIGGAEKFTIQKRDVNYIVRLAYSRKLDKDNKTVTVNVKSKSALQTLVEDVLYYHLNGLHVPNVTITNSAQVAIDKAKIADAAAAEGKKNESTAVAA